MSDDEKPFPSRFGTLYEKVFGKDDPFNDPRNSKGSIRYVHDEMPPTRNPLNPKEIYTSKAKLRAAYKAAGVVEVGDAFEKGYDPRKEREAESRKHTKQMIQQMRERYNGG